MQIIVMQTGLDAGKQSSAHQLLLRSQPLVRGVVCNSRSAYALAVEGYRVPPSRVFVVPSAIDSDWLGPLSEQRMAPGGLVRVAMVGSARSEKNLLHAFQAFAALERVTSANLVVYSADASIHREVAGKAGANAVTFVEDHLVAKEDLDRVDVLLHPSVSESLPRAVIEALARGVAVVAGPLPEFEGLDRPSVIVEPADSDSVAEGLARAARFVLGMPVRRRPPGFQFSTPPEYARDLVRSIREVL
jgi:glycosyltransferase involved in cell wall biosynthesis